MSETKPGREKNIMKTIENLKEFERFGSKLGLERIELLLGLLGNPEKNLKVIHVAGTNGKGSVSRLMYNALLENNYSVGLFTSPFLEIFNERIELNGQFISDEKLDELSQKVIEVAKKVEEVYESPTEFEIITAIALLFFSEANTDFVVLEVGLGGRGDSTNVIKNPVATIITSISYDHMDRLGDTLEEIAFEKAGIIKENTPLIMNVNDEGARKVIAKVCYEKNALLFDMKKVKYSIAKEDFGGTIFSTNIQGTNYDDVGINLLGRHQVDNCLTTLAAIEILRKNGIIKVHRDQLYSGLDKTTHKGRFEVIQGNLPLIIDGAHNGDAMDKLNANLERLLPGMKPLVILGMLKDKLTDDFLDSVCDLGDFFVLKKPNNPRGLETEVLAEALKQKGKTIIGYDDDKFYKQWLEIAKEKKCDYVLCTGSLYFIGEVRRLLIETFGE